MEVCTSLKSLVRLPIPYSRIRQIVPLKTLLLPSHRVTQAAPPKRRRLTLVQAKKTKRLVEVRQNQKRQVRAPPKLEEDEDTRFLIFISGVNTSWYPLSTVTGGPAAKIIFSAKGNFLGKFIFKGTLDTNLAMAIYTEERDIQEFAKKKYPILRSITQFRYGYKIVNDKNLQAALSTTSNIIKLPTKDKFINTTVLGKVKNWLDDAKQSFRRLVPRSVPSDTFSGVETNGKPEEDSEDEAEDNGLGR